MKALLFGLLTLQFITTEGAYGMKENSSEQQKSPLQECGRFLLDKFCPMPAKSEEETTDKQDKITVMDISFFDPECSAEKSIELTIEELMNGMKKVEKAEENLLKRKRGIESPERESEYFSQFYLDKPYPKDNESWQSSSDSYEWGLLDEKDREGMWEYNLRKRRSEHIYRITQDFSLWEYNFRKRPSGQFKEKEEQFNEEEESSPSDPKNKDRESMWEDLCYNLGKNI